MNEIQNIGTEIERIIIGGDLSKLNPEQRMQYCKAVCESAGLNPLTKPFDYITLNNKLTLYANKGCAEQLRMIHKISIRITSREMIGDVYVVTAQAKNAEGREDESTGTVATGGMKGDMLANAYLKAETKAKRRVTLSICGLNMLDQSEVEAVPVTAANPTIQPNDVQVPATTPAPQYNWSPHDGDKPATENQRRMIWARIKNDLKLSDDAAKDFMVRVTECQHSKEWTMGHIQKLVQAIDAAKFEQQELLK